MASSARRGRQFLPLYSQQRERTIITARRSARPRAAVGELSVNQAVKAIIIARGNVEGDKFDLVVLAKLMPSTGPDALDLTLRRIALRAAPLPAAAGDDALKTKSATAASKLAAVLAQRVRAGARAVSTTAIGPSAMLTSAKAIALARRFVGDDGHELSASPRFVKLALGGEQRTGVVFDIILEPREPARTV